MFLTTHNGIPMSWRARKWAEATGRLPSFGSSLMVALIRQGVCSKDDVSRAAFAASTPLEREAACEWAEAIGKAAVFT